MKWVENPPAAVLVANQFNLSIFNQIWLAKQGVLDAEGTVNSGSIFSDNVVQVLTPSFLLLVFLEQLQFAVSVPHEQQQSLVTEKLGQLVQAVPHVPYSALGLNFYWHLIPEGEEVGQLTRRLFEVPQGGVFARFSDMNARFGAYMSRDFGEFRMKLDIKPVRATRRDTGVEEDQLQFGFNFHADLMPGDSAVPAILKCLSRWDEVRAEVTETIQTAGYGAKI